MRVFYHKDRGCINTFMLTKSALCALTSVRNERFMLYGIVMVLGDGGRK